MKKTIITIIFIATQLALIAQNARNGYHYPTSDTLRAFVVFAQIEGETNLVWTENEMPDNPEIFFDHSFSSEENIEGSITKFFYDASFGKCVILGDYYPELIKVSNLLYDEVADSLHHLPGSTIITANGYDINSNAFDMWSFDYNEGKADTKAPDGYIDMMFIIWNRNTGQSGNSQSRTYYSAQIKGKSGLNGYCNIWTSWGDVWQTIYHEYSHTLIGGNDFHSGGANYGDGTFLGDFSGYSMLSGWNRNNDFVNAWDRWRLGWKQAGKRYYISAKTPYTGAEIETDFEYGDSFGRDGNEFILRDFYTTGDAIRIELPFLESGKKKQYIWIENHQYKSGTIEHNNCSAKGIYINYQIGNDNLEEFDDSRTNNIMPLSAFGNFDWEYDGYPFADYITDDSKSNPLSGYSISSLHPIETGSTTHFIGEISNKELVISDAVIYNNQLLTNKFCISDMPYRGSVYDGFSVGTSLGISSNPALTTVLTHKTRDRQWISLAIEPATDDNRTIHLNGLSVDILSQYSDGSIKVKIRWDNFNVDNDVRWCGNIELHENLYVKPGKKINIDLGLSAQKSKNPITHKGETIFNDFSVFTCKENSYLRMEENSTIELNNNSAFVLESGSELEINDGAVFTVKQGCSFLIKSGATLTINGSGRIEIESGAYICREGSGSAINLVDGMSVVNLRYGYISGVNTSVISPSPVCAPFFKTSGNGYVNTFENTLLIQNEIISNNQYRTGANIKAGYNVFKPYTPYGNVIIQNNAHVIFEARDNVLLDKGFEVKLGSTLEVK